MRFLQPFPYFHSVHGIKILFAQCTTTTTPPKQQHNNSVLLTKHISVNKRLIIVNMFVSVLLLMTQTFSDELYDFFTMIS